MLGKAAGSVLSGGLDNILKDLQSSGHGKVAQSWVGTGPNEEIAPKDLAKALGNDAIDALTKRTGMSRDELLEGLSQQLPGLVDQLTPQGRLPTEHEASRMALLPQGVARHPWRDVVDQLEHRPRAAPVKCRAEHLKRRAAAARAPRSLSFGTR